MGIGGVGGYIGGKLAVKYFQSKDFEIVFIARGDNQNEIQKNGLKLITANGEQIAHPKLVSDSAEVIGSIDFLICTVKSYDLIDSIKQYQDCIHSKTIILPLQNGVNSSKAIRSVIPNVRIWEGCIYINSRLSKPGVIIQIGSTQLLYFNPNASTNEEIEKIKGLFNNAGINICVSDKIEQTIWEKFLFISPIATITSYLNVCIGEVIRSEQNKELLKLLVSEVKSIAEAKQISLPYSVIQKVIDKASAMPFEATSSMHTDFKNKKKTEMDALVRYVIDQGKIFNIPTPTYESILTDLLNRNKYPRL